MRLAIRPVSSRWPRVPLWALVVVLVWGTMVVSFEVVKWATEADADTTVCLLRSTTGIPCPTCGSTRAVKGIASAQIVDGISHNPFMVVLLTVGVLWFAAHILFKRRVTVAMSQVTRRATWIVVVALFLANWAWVISRH